MGLRNMSILQISGIVIGSLVSIGVLVAGAGYAYSQWFKGKNSKTLEDFQLFNSQIDALNKVCVEQSNQIKVLEIKVKENSIEIEHLRNTNKQLSDLLANRDPALAQYMEYGRASIEEFKDGLREVITKLDDISKK